MTDPLGIGWMATFILMAVLGFALYYFGNWKAKTKNAFLIVGVLGIAGVLLTPGLIIGGTTDTQAIVGDSTVEWIVADAEASAYITEPQPHEYLVQFEYDQTLAQYNNDSEWFNITGTVSRADTGSAPAFTNCAISSVSTYTAQTATWGTRDVVEKNADGSYNYIWTDSNSAAHSGVDMGIPRLDTMRTDSFTFSCRPDQIIPDDMSLYDSFSQEFIVGGQVIKVTWMLTLIDNLSGTASSA